MTIKKTHPRIKRYDRIYGRSANRMHGSAYVPCIKANKAEAPSISRASILSEFNKLGRQVHALSQPELGFELLALYNPDVVDLKEQLRLSPFPDVHPFVGHPCQGTTVYPDVPGVVAVAKDLGQLDKLNRYRTVNEDGELVFRLVPMVGDLLLAIRDNGQLRGVNWNVKQAHRDFERANPGLLQARNAQRRIDNAIRRNKIEGIYFELAGIPTLQVAYEDLPRQLVANLTSCYVGQAKSLRNSHGGHESELTHSVLPLFKERCSVAGAFKATSSRLKIAYHHYRDFWYSSIWRRSIDVDLFHPLFLNGPVYPQTRDPLVEFKKWFNGEVL